MHFLYFLTLKIVECLLPAVAFFSSNKKLKAFVKGRENLFEVLKLEQNPERYWFHCASLGEFEQTRPLIEAIKKQRPSCSIVISFFSPSGYEQRKNYELAEAVFYLPIDTPKHAKQLIAVIKPKAVVFVKYEIWYFLLKKLFETNIPVYLISAHFREGQFIFKPWGKWLFQLLPRYTHIFLQNKTSFNLLKNKGLENISISGDTRYDRVIQNATMVKTNTRLEDFKQHYSLLILGSSWPKEEAILLEAMHHKNWPKDLKIIIAPHDISESHINDILKKFHHFNPILYTLNINLKNTNMLLLNTIGHLASAYHYADMAFIGGGFTGQLHNILEPLAFGVPIITGPVHHKFPEADMANKAGVLLEANDADSFVKNVLALQNAHLKPEAQSFIKLHSGATELVIKTILN